MALLGSANPVTRVVGVGVRFDCTRRAPSQHRLEQLVSDLHPPLGTTARTVKSVVPPQTAQSTLAVEPVPQLVSSFQRFMP